MRHNIKFIEYYELKLGRIVLQVLHTS